MVNGVINVIGGWDGGSHVGTVEAHSPSGPSP